MNKKSKNQFIFSKLFAMLSFLCLMASLNMNVSFGFLFFVVSITFAGVSLVLGVCSEDK